MILCLVTPGRLAAGDSPGADRLIARIREAGEAGVDLIQVRERSLDAAALLRLVARAVEAAPASRVLVNDRTDVALAAGAAGVHLRGDACPAPRVRAMTPPEFVIGRSVHARDEATAVAAAGGVDYLLFGTVFPSGSKPPGHRAAGLEALREVAAAVPLPVLAIGGITPERVPRVLEAGAAGVAAIEMFSGARPIADVVAALRGIH